MLVASLIITITDYLIKVMYLVDQVGIKMSTRPRIFLHDIGFCKSQFLHTPILHLERCDLVGACAVALFGSAGIVLDVGCVYGELVALYDADRDS